MADACSCVLVVLGQERKLLVKRPGEGGEGKEGE